MLDGLIPALGAAKTEKGITTEMTSATIIKVFPDCIFIFILILYRCNKHKTRHGFPTFAGRTGFPIRRSSNPMTGSLCLIVFCAIPTENYGFRQLGCY